jgi:GT2 family glycosyltransferase
MKPNIGIIILNWNNWPDTSSCLAKLNEISYPQESLKLIVVDNGSTDDLPIGLLALEGVELIKLDENRGFAGGNNVGIDFALKAGCEYVLLINNDTQITPGFLQPLLEVFESEPDVGIVAPKIYYTDPPNRIWYAGGKFRQPRIIGELIGMDEFDTGQYNQAGPVDFAVGACMLIKREVFDRIGLLDDDLFFYHEDVDFSYRTMQAGLTTWYQPASSIWHDVSHSTASNLPHRTYLYAHARTIFLCKHIRGIKIPIVIGMEAIRLLRTIARNYFSGQPELANSYLKGVIHGLIEARKIYSRNIP